MSETEKSILDLFTQDVDAESQGIMRKIGTTKFWIRALSSDPVQKVVRLQSARLDRIRESNGGDVPKGIQDAADAEFAAAMIAKWEDCPDPRDGGKSMLDYSAENAKVLMGFPRLRPLMQRIIQISRDEQNYRAAEIAAMEGNSSPSSDGNSNMETAPAS